jgi:NTE family protein
MAKKKRKKIGLALSGGAFRGFGHIGALKALKEADIKFDIISGSSIGALFAAYYSLYQNIDDLTTDLMHWQENHFFKFIKPNLKGGVISYKKMHEYLNRIIGNHNFSQTKISLRIVATDLLSGEIKIFRSGKILPAVYASCAIPVIFEPIKVNDKAFVDGALSNPLPIDVLKKEKVDKVIAINLYNKNEFIDKKMNYLSSAFRANRILIHNLAKEQARQADLEINPDLSLLVNKAGLKNIFNKEMASQAIDISYQLTKKNINKIRKLIK